jgi:hypothetical protein
MKSQNVLKRTLAGVLAVLTVAGSIPANVGTGGLFGGSTIVASAETRQADSEAALIDAIAAAEDNDVIELTGDVTLTSAIVVTGKTVTIQGNATITSDADDIFSAGAGGTIVLGEGLVVNGTSSVLYAYDGGRIIVDGAELNAHNSPYTMA